MTHSAPQPRNRQLSELADACLAAICDDPSPEQLLREASFAKDSRLIAIAERSFGTKQREFDRNRRLDLNECAIAASFYRDVRVYAAEQGLHDLFQFAFVQEYRLKRNMAFRSRTLRGVLTGVVITLWGLTSCYGTSLARWLFSGVSIVAFFTAAIVFSTSSTMSTVSWGEGSLVSIETFAQISYDTTLSGGGLRGWLLVERLTGMAYFVFGFSLLLPRFSMELSRDHTLTLKQKQLVREKENA